MAALFSSARPPHASRPPFCALPRSDPLEPAGRLAVVAVAHAGRTLVRGRRLARLAPARGVHARHLPDAQRGLLRQRRGRPRFRSPCEAHGPAARDERRDVGQGGAGAGRGAGAAVLRAGAHHQPHDGAVVVRGAGDHADLSVRQALRVDPAGGAGHRLQLRHPDGLCRGAVDGAGLCLVAAGGQPVLGAGLRHRVRDGGPRRRPEDRHEDLGHHLRPFRRGGGDGQLRDLPGGLDLGRCQPVAGGALLCRHCRGGGAGALALAPDP
ncbi:hypothetical protein D9M72_313040 [compost metagenome]